MEKPFQAYIGMQPYVFVCYAHEDSVTVYTEMAWLVEQEANIWYDEGISAGENWRAAIGDSLLGSSHVLFYISKNSLNSDHCNREINLALDEGMQVVPVYLEEIELTSDLKVGLNRVQALHRNKDANYQQHLLNALGLDSSNVELKSQISPLKRWRKSATITGVLLTMVLALGYIYRDAVIVAIALNAPELIFGEPLKEELNFLTRPDGTRIAYATTGAGPPIVQVQDFGTHLGKGGGSVFYDTDGIIAMTSRDHLLVRYDGRGSGLSTRDITDYSLQARVSDLKAVVDALNLERFDLLGVSAGGPPAIAFTAQNPDRVNRLVLAGAMASTHWMDDKRRESWERTLNLYEVDWDRPATTNIMVSMMLSPNNDAVTLRLVGEFLRRSVDGQMVARFFREQFSIDNTSNARAIRAPTLVIHASDDAAIGLEAGLEIAELVSGSVLEIVEGGHFVGSGSSIAVRKRILDFFEAEN